MEQGLDNNEGTKRSDKVILANIKIYYRIAFQLCPAGSQFFFTKKELKYITHHTTMVDCIGDDNKK
jgi:hypothetical protein